MREARLTYQNGEGRLEIDGEEALRAEFPDWAHAMGEANREVERRGAFIQMWFDVRPDTEWTARIGSAPIPMD